MKPLNIAVIGATGTGKTTACKKLLNLSGKEPFIYDVNNEYGSKTLLKINDFLLHATKKTNSFILFEEATIFFSHSGRTDEIMNLLVRKRHTNNVICLVFHSLRSMPLYILDMIDLIILFKTVENKGVIEKKYKDEIEILEAFNFIANSPNKHENTIINRR